jgi:hypothetical protein
MIFANDARKLAQERLKLITSVELDLIEEQINEAISQGKFSISNDASMTPHCKVTLEGLGYKVDVGIQYNQPYYTITW